MSTRVLTKRLVHKYILDLYKCFCLVQKTIAKRGVVKGELQGFQAAFEVNAFLDLTFVVAFWISFGRRSHIEAPL